MPVAPKCLLSRLLQTPSILLYLSRLAVGLQMTSAPIRPPLNAFTPILHSSWISSKKPSKVRLLLACRDATRSPPLNVFLVLLIDRTRVSFNLAFFPILVVKAVDCTQRLLNLFSSAAFSCLLKATISLTRLVLISSFWSTVMSISSSILVKLTISDVVSITLPSGFEATKKYHKIPWNLTEYLTYHCCSNIRWKLYIFDQGQVKP